MTAPADALEFDVRLGSFGPRSGATSAPGPQDLGQLEGTPRSLAAALTGAGAKRVSITLDSTLTSQNSYPFSVRGYLEHPTHDRILGLVLSGALATAPDGGAIPVQNASGMLFVNDCTGLNARAEAAAFDDAKRRATALALHAHLRLGDVRGVTLRGAFAPCDPALTNGFFGGGGGGAGLPLDGPYTVTAFSTIEVTFSVR